MTPLVLLPGMMCDARLWGPQMAALGRRAVLHAPLTGQDSIEGLAASVLEVAPPRFALAGLSMGGIVAMEVLRQAPERVERLALIDTSARQDSDEQRRRRTGLIELADKGRFKGVTPRLLPMLVHRSRLEDGTVTRPIFDMAGRIGKDGFIRQQKAILSRDDSRDLLADIAVPTLVMCGRDDQLTPVELSEEMADGIPGSVLHIVEECGHLPALERPEECGGRMRSWLVA